MKNFSELTLKQAKLCTWICSLVPSFLLSIFMYFLTCEIGICPAIIISTLFFLFATSVLYIISRVMFGVDRIIYKEKNADTKTKIISTYNLTKTNFTTLEFICNNPGIDFESQLFSAMLLKSNYEVRAKITDNDEIRLFVYLSENLIYTHTIKDFIYFEEHFKKRDK